MNAYMLVPLIFSPSHRRKIYEKESHPAKALPALPRLWLPITPYKYVTVHMETRRHKNTWIHACECMHTRKRSFMRRLWCFAFPQQEASCWSSGAEGRGKAAVLQCDHDSTCWTLQDKGPRGDKLGMEGTEDRQEVLVQSKNYPAAGVETELALQVLHTPTRTVLPAPFIHWVCLFILLERQHCLSPAGAETHDEHDPVATSPQAAKCRWSKWTPQTLSGWKSFLSSIWK